MRPIPIKPQPGQESVWDYPRPPRVEPTSKHVQIYFNGVLIADTRNAKRVLETASPPGFYLPPEDVRMEFLHPAGHGSWCEWKGRASYYTLTVGDQTVPNVAWYYPKPTPAFVSITNHIAFYPRPMDKCLVDGEVVVPQPGRFYGGWITSDVVGPFKGEPGTLHW